MRIGGLVVWLLVVLAPLDLPAVEFRPRSILVLGQSDLRWPFYYQAFSALIAAIILVQGALISILLHKQAELRRTRGGRSGSQEESGQRTSLKGRGAARSLATH